MRHDLPALKLLWALSMAAGCSATIPFDDLSSGAAGDGDGDSPNEDFSCDDHKGAAFCDDFDGESLVDKWGNPEIFPTEDQGVVESRSDGALSKPNAMVATMKGDFPADTDYAASFITKTFSTVEDRAFDAHVSFAIKVEDFDGHATARITAFQFLMGDEASYNQLVLNIVSQGTSIASVFSENLGGEREGTHEGDTESGPALQEWTQVEFDLHVKDPTGDGNTAKLTVGGKVLFDNKLQQDLLGGVPRFELGIPWVNTELATDDWRIRYDNVLVEIEKIED
jgi:hypothetical protein